MIIKQIILSIIATALAFIPTWIFLVWNPKLGFSIGDSMFDVAMIKYFAITILIVFQLFFVVCLFHFMKTIWDKNI